MSIKNVEEVRIRTDLGYHILFFSHSFVLMLLCCQDRLLAVVVVGG